MRNDYKKQKKIINRLRLKNHSVYGWREERERERDTNAFVVQFGPTIATARISRIRFTVRKPKL